MARRGAPPAGDDPVPVTVTVVGDRCFGPVDDALADGARRLAAAAGAGLLAVRFDGDRDRETGASFLGADPWPDPTPPAIADALLAYLRGARGEGRRASGEGEGPVEGLALGAARRSSLVARPAPRSVGVQ